MVFTFRKREIILFVLISLTFSNIPLFNYFLPNGILTSLNYYVPVISYILIIIYCYSLARHNLVESRFAMQLNLLPYLVATILSVFLFIINNNGMGYYSRLISTVLYYFLGMYAAKLMLDCLKGKLLDIYWDATLFVYLCSVIVGIVVGHGTGLQEYIDETFNNMVIINNPSKGFFEVHELLFIFGLFIIYFLFFDEHKTSKGWMRFWLTCLCFIFGWKRIGLAGLLVAVFFAAITNHNGESLLIPLIRITSFITIIITYIYIYILLDGTLMADFAKFNINDMGRTIIYDTFRQICNFSINYIGKGFTFVSRYIESLGRSQLGNMASVRGLHCSVLEKYIELGFIGSGIWNFWFLYHINSTYIKKFGYKTALCYLLLTIYSYVTYLTDNTQSYRNYQMVLMVLPIVYYLSNSKKDKSSGI